ncbi:MAG: fasciclin domain-containing protein [Rhodoferax sp.]|uniref:fasciclin domain-containing protein n=1 Tax=Rhodoferax sp. TaxID=50421 RepID=UPI003017E3DF
MLNRRALSLAIISAVLAGCASVPAPVSVVDTIAKNPALSTFNHLMGQSSLAATLQGTGPFTVFAPSNDAFKLVPTKTMEDLIKHPEKMKSVLAFHIIPGKMLASDIKNNSLKTLNDSNVSLSKAGEFATIEEAMVQTADIQASNGVIHIIDAVLTPPHKK